MLLITATAPVFRLLDPALYGLHVSLAPHLRTLSPCGSLRINWDYLLRSCHLLVTHFVDLALSLLQLLGLRRWTHGKAGADAYGVQPVLGAHGLGTCSASAFCLGTFFSPLFRFSTCFRIFSRQCLLCILCI